jgi:hypothetical protein
MIVSRKTADLVVSRKRETRSNRINELHNKINLNHDDELELIILEECEWASNNIENELENTNNQENIRSVHEMRIRKRMQNIQ